MVDNGDGDALLIVAITKWPSRDHERSRRSLRCWLCSKRIEDLRMFNGSIVRYVADEDAVALRLAPSRLRRWFRTRDGACTSVHIQRSSPQIVRLHPNRRSLLASGHGTPSDAVF